MESVTVSELNRQTAKVLDRIKAGESLEISEYGQIVARLLPATPTTGSPLLDRLIAQGRALPATNLGPLPPTPPRDSHQERVALRQDETRGTPARSAIHSSSAGVWASGATS